MATIRLAETEDAASIAAIYRPYVMAAATSFELQPPEAAEMADRMRAVLSHAPWLVYANEAKVLGYAYASRHRDRVAYQWAVDVTVYLHGDHHRRGIGRALYRSLFALLRLQGFYTAHAGITLPNAGSVGLHEALGFRLVGVYPNVGWKHGSWHDVGWWQLPLQDRPATPAPPLSLEEVRKSPGWAAALAGGLEGRAA